MKHALSPEKRRFLGLLTEDLMTWSTRGPNVERGGSETAATLRATKRLPHVPMDRMRTDPGGITVYWIECTCGEYVTFEATNYRDVRGEFYNHRSVRQERERKAGVR